MGAEGQKVHQCRHHGGVLERLRPAGEGQVRGHDGAGLLAAAEDHFERQLGLVAVEAEIVQIIAGAVVSALTYGVTCFW